MLGFFFPWTNMFFCVLMVLFSHWLFSLFEASQWHNFSTDVKEVKHFPDFWIAKHTCSLMKWLKIGLDSHMAAAWLYIIYIWWKSLVSNEFVFSYLEYIALQYTKTVAFNLKQVEWYMIVFVKIWNGVHGVTGTVCISCTYRWLHRT